MHSKLRRVSWGLLGCACDHRGMTVRSWHFLAIAAGLVVAFIGFYLFFVHGYMGQLLDEQARVGAQFAAASRFADALDAVPLVSAGVVVLAVVVVVVGASVVSFA